MSDEESSQGDDDAAGMFATTDALGDDDVGASAASVLARKKAKLTSSSSKRPNSSKRSSSSSSSRTRPVVKLMVTSVSRSYSEPWRRKPQRESSGTGFLISWEEDHHNNPSNISNSDGDGDANGTTTANKQHQQQHPIRIITNAHVVRNATTVRARASFGPHVVSCEVEWLSLPLDLALLRITEGDWNDFCKGWSFDNLLNNVANDVVDGTAAAETIMTEGATTTNSNNNNTAIDAAAVNGNSSNNNNNNNVTKLLTLSTGLPKLDENVTCVGFPQGGTQISVTRGVVSRIDVDSQYVLRIQIDAAINPGNSGGVSFFVVVKCWFSMLSSMLFLHVNVAFRLCNTIIY